MSNVWLLQKLVCVCARAHVHLRARAHVYGAKKAHQLLTHKLFLPPFGPGSSQGQTGLVPWTNWASTVPYKEETWVCPKANQTKRFIFLCLFLV